MTTATQTQLRRDTAANVNPATPAAGEPAWDTTNKILRVGDGTTVGGIHQVGAKQAQTDYYLYGTVGGSANAITATNVVPMLGLVAGLKQKIKATATNTTATTFAPDGLTTKNIKKMLDGALADVVAGDIVNGGIYDLEYDGTQWQIQGLGTRTQTPAGLCYLGTYTASSSASLDITSAMSSTYNDYLLILDNLVPASAGVNLLMRMSPDNGSSYDSAAHYASVISNFKSSSSAASIGNQNGASSIRAALGMGVGSPVSGAITLHGVNTATYQQIEIATSFTDGTDITSHKGAGLWSNSSAYNAVKFFMSSGNITSGNIKIYGISKT